MGHDLYRFSSDVGAFNHLKEITRVHCNEFACVIAYAGSGLEPFLDKLSMCNVAMASTMVVRLFIKTVCPHSHDKGIDGGDGRQAEMASSMLRIGIWV